MTIERRQTTVNSHAEEGIVTAYLTKWDTVDDYQSTFLRGAFQKSFEERGPKGIRHIWNHEKLAGKVLSCREDNVGPLVTVQFNLETEAGREAFSHVKNGDVNCFSFGFRTVKDSYKRGVRQIEEADLREVGAVVFEANPNAEIISVRAAELPTEDLIGAFAHKLAAGELSPEQRQRIDGILNPEQPEDNNGIMAGLEKMEGLLA